MREMRGCDLVGKGAQHCASGAKQLSKDTPACLSASWQECTFVRGAIFLLKRQYLTRTLLHAFLGCATFWLHSISFIHIFHYSCLLSKLTQLCVHLFHLARHAMLYQQVLLRFPLLLFCSSDAGSKNFPTQPLLPNKSKYIPAQDLSNGSLKNRFDNHITNKRN